MEIPPKWYLTVVCAVLISTSAALGNENPATTLKTTPQASQNSGHVRRHKLYIAPILTTDSYRDYVVKTSYGPNFGHGHVEILKASHLVWSADGFRFFIGKMYESDSDAKLVEMGKDITGNGQPDLLISEWTGGAHCCLMFHIFEIGSQFREIATIDEASTDAGPHFRLGQGPGLDIVVSDWTFAYWETSFAESPAPDVILRYRNGQYRFAADAMWKAPPKLAELESKAKEIDDTDADEAYPPSALWAEMLDLIYTGHADLARKFLDMSWRPPLSGSRELIFRNKQDFWRAFRARLARSRYWPEIREFNKGQNL